MLLTLVVTRPAPSDVFLLFELQLRIATYSYPQPKNLMRTGLITVSVLGLQYSPG